MPKFKKLALDVLTVGLGILWSEALLHYLRIIN